VLLIMITCEKTGTDLRGGIRPYEVKTVVEGRLADGMDGSLGHQVTEASLSTSLAPCSPKASQLANMVSNADGAYNLRPNYW